MCSGVASRKQLSCGQNVLIRPINMENMSEFELQLAALPEDFIIWHYKVHVQSGRPAARG